MFLVDSTIYIDWMRHGLNPVQLLLPHVQMGEALTCGVVRLEVVRGLVHLRVKETLNELFDLMPTVDTTVNIWSAAAELAWRLDRKGKVLPVTDLIIAACAKSVQADVISLDRHFGEIPGILWKTRIADVR